MTSLNDYYNEIRNDIAKEFGLEAIGYGSPRITNEQIRNAQIKWDSLSESEQKAILASRGF